MYAGTAADRCPLEIDHRGGQVGAVDATEGQVGMEFAAPPSLCISRRSSQTRLPALAQGMQHAFRTSLASNLSLRERMDALEACSLKHTATTAPLPHRVIAAAEVTTAPIRRRAQISIPPTLTSPRCPCHQSRCFLRGVSSPSRGPSTSRFQNWRALWSPL
jgi:hypothetical protein